MPIVDVVIVSYNSRNSLRGTVESLATSDDVHVIVVDNASADGSLESIAELRHTPLHSPSFSLVPLVLGSGPH